MFGKMVSNYAVPKAKERKREKLRFGPFKHSPTVLVASKAPLSPVHHAENHLRREVSVGGVCGGCLSLLFFPLRRLSIWLLFDFNYNVLNCTCILVFNLNDGCWLALFGLVGSSRRSPSSLLGRWWGWGHRWRLRLRLWLRLWLRLNFYSRLLLLLIVIEIRLSIFTIRGVFFFGSHLSFSSSFALLCLSSIFPFYTIWTSTVICMPRHCVPAGECFPTLRTDKGRRDKVGIMIALEMHVKELLLAEGLVAVAAGIRLLSRVGALVHDHVPLLSTSVITLVALEALLIFV